MSSGNWCICRSISVLQRQRDRDEALVTLTRAARQVEPIMKKRGWVVHQLSEFLPRSQGLLGLNVNRGQQVKVRMRRSAGGGFLCRAANARAFSSVGRSSSSSFAHASCTAATAAASAAQAS